MKKEIKSIMAAACLFAALTSCSNNDINTSGNETGKGLQFSFTEAAYDEDQELTRSCPKSTTVNLGDCEAEVSIENDPTPQTPTRSITSAHYTIRAYKDGVKKGEISGTFTGSTFVEDPTSGPGISLKQHGVYDFVAFNDDVVSVGDELTIAPDKAETARIGTLTETINQEPEQTISFEMKHVGARVKIELSSRKHFPEPLKATVRNVDEHNASVTINYNPATKVYTKGTTTTDQSVPVTFPVSSQPLYVSSGYGDTYGFTSTNVNYIYLLPGSTDSKVRVQFTAGTHFWKTLAGTAISNLFSPAPNGSYKVKVKMKPRYTYLFNDGTTGFLTAPENASKKAVGIEVAPGLAVALKDIPNSMGMEWSNISNTSNLQQYKNRFADAKQTVDGYDITWNGNQTTNPAGMVKGNNDTNFPLFYYAGHYDEALTAEGITITGGLVGKKWFLPSLGEWIIALKTLGFLDDTALTGYSGWYDPPLAPWYGNLSAYAFMQVPGGYNIPSFAATANEYDIGSVIRLKCFVTGITVIEFSKQAIDYPARAFIRY